MELGLAGRKAVVTGGTRGLGRAIAEELAREGADVAICARDGAQVSRTGEELRAHGTVIHAQVADVTDVAQIEDFVASAARALSGIDILVNNAGGARPGSFETLTDEDWQADLDVKLFSMIRCTREVLPHMRGRGGGSIVNINAVLGEYPHPSFFA